MSNAISSSRAAMIRATLFSITLGGMLIPLNSSMIAVALPDIIREFGVSVDAAGWLVTAYLITMAMLQLVAGRFGDQFGRRKLVLGGLVYFGVVSLLAALAPTLGILIFLRVQQAMAGALIATNGLALAFQIVPGHQRGSTLGWVNAAMVLAAAGGPPLSGLLVGMAGWQAIFWVNLPPVIAALLLGWISIPKDMERASPSSHFKALSRLRLVHRPTFIFANAAIAFSNLAMYVTLLAIPIMLANRAEWTSAQTGLILAAMSMTMALFSPLGGRWADRIGRRWPVLVGLAIVALALIPLARQGADISIANLVVCLAGSGTGLGLATSALQTSALESVGAEQAGIASGIASTSRYLGSIVGSSILTTLLGTTSANNFQSIFLIVAVAGGSAVLCGFGIHNATPQEAN